MPHRERKNNIIRVRHMLDFGVKAVEFTREKSRPDLDTDEIRLWAVAHLVEMMSHAAGSVTQEFREKYKEVPWSQIAAAGARLSPGDGGVDRDMIWAMASRDLPALIMKLRKIIREEG